MINKCKSGVGGRFGGVIYAALSRIGLAQVEMAQHKR